MRTEVRLDVDTARVKGVVGPAAYGRALDYVRKGAVVKALWNPEKDSLVGTVHGSGGHVYTTTARFSPTGGTYSLFNGECSCPVGVNCKHVAALVLSIRGNAEPAQPATTPPAASWDTYLGSVLDASGPGQEHTETTPLAVELTLAVPTRAFRSHQSGPSAPQVNARLVRPGKRSGWVGGDLSWTTLRNLRFYGDYDDTQVRLLQELYAMYRSHEGAASSFGYRDEKSLDLSTFSSHQLWPLLDEARAAGVRLVYARKRHHALDHYYAATMHLDVTRGTRQGALVVTPILHVEGSDADAAPVAFVGTNGHGVAYAAREDIERDGDPATLPFRLAKLDRDVPAELQRMVLAGKKLSIPAADQARFRDEFYPRLRHLATVTSSDGAFVPPEVSEPTLVLHADYGDGHELELSWEWSYRVGESELREPPKAAGTDSGYRNPAAERELLAGLDAPLEKFGLARRGGQAGEPERAVNPHVGFDGIDTMRVSTELLPLLRETSGVEVEVTGTPADYREAGDSLRIGVSTEDTANEHEHDWFDLGVTITVEGREVPFETLFSALARDHSYLMLNDGAYFSLQKPELQSLRRLIEEARALQDAPAGELKISRFQAGLWEELAALGVVESQADEWQRQVQGLLSLGEIDTPETPPTLSAQLRPYQSDGFSWLAFLFNHQLGGVLADDMGLGKTLQTLALVSHANRDNPGCAPFLIVAPASVVANWTAEAARFTPELSVVAATGTVKRNGKPLEEIAAGTDVMITSYTLFRLDFEHYAELGWSGLVLDEAQFAKNHQSKIYRCARELPAPFKLAITGTPMENNLMELWSMLSITAPGLFPNPTRFRDYYARPIESGGDGTLLAQLRQRIKPLVKRRTKEQVAAELPAKQEQVLEVELHSQHRKLYQRYLQRERQKVLGLLDDFNGNRFTILRSLTLLRRLSLHAGLVDDEHEDMPSAKIDALFEQLGDVTGSGHRALVFSQFTGFLNHVRSRLDAESVGYCYLDGKTRRRAEVIEQFKSGTAPVFLISLKAGGFGLNLTEADYCFLLDPWWNPATEKQAVDRTHRIGQDRNVVVYRLIAKDTIEEKVMALQQRKAELFTSVMDDGDAFGGALGADDIKALLAG